MIDPSIIDALIAAGATAEMIAAAHRADHAIEQAKVADRRAKATERKRRQRSRDVTVTERDSAGHGVTERDTLPPPSPPSMVSLNNPSLTTPSSPAIPSASLRSAARQRASRLPSDWVPSAEDFEFAHGRGVPHAQIRLEAEKFRNYWTAKAGKDATKLDWPATWRNWILNAGQRAPPGAAAAPRPGSKEDTRERTVHALRKLTDYVDAHADDEGGSGQAREANAGLLPFAKPA